MARYLVPLLGSAISARANTPSASCGVESESREERMEPRESMGTLSALKAYLRAVGTASMNCVCLRNNNRRVATARTICERANDRIVYLVLR